MRKNVLRIHKMITKGNALIFYRILSINFFCGYCRASDISRGRGRAKFRHFREKKTRNTAKSTRNISKYMSAKHI